MKEFPKPINKECLKNTMFQMDNSIYKIVDNKRIIGICIFCYIRYKKMNFPVIITTYNIINESFLANRNSIKILIKNEIKKIEFRTTKYICKDYNISIIEIKENNENKINFLEVDDNIYNTDSEIKCNKESIYILNYDNENNISVSFGVINKIINSKLLICSFHIYSNQIGLPIFNLSNNKLIGLYIKKSMYYQKGIFFKYLINEFINEYKFSKNELICSKNIINEIDILLNIENEDINKEIYFLDNYEYIDKEGIKHYHDNLNELNQSNAELYINNNKYEYKKYYKPNKSGKFHIRLKFNIILTNCSYMFAGCKNIININFISFNTKYITNMKYMFYQCENLKNVNLLSFNTKNVNDMSFMFYGCSNLTFLDLSSFDINNNINTSFMTSKCKKLKSTIINKNEIYLIIKVNEDEINEKIYFLGNYFYKKIGELNKSNVKIYINNDEYENNNYFLPKQKGEYFIKLIFDNILIDCNYMFVNCSNIISIDFTFFITKNVRNMKYMFYRCENLRELNLLFFDTENVCSMNAMFSECVNLNNLDLSSFNTKNVTNMSSMFLNCINLTELDLSSFNTDNVNDMNSIFSNCTNLIHLNISSFNTENVYDMSFMFSNCQNLNILDLSFFDTKNVKDMSGMFSHCFNLKYLNLSKLNTDNVTKMNYMFHNCLELINLNLFNFNTKNVTDMSNMFSNCIELKSLDLSFFDTKNVTDMSYMFCFCENLSNLNVSSFDTKNVVDMNHMFSHCFNLDDLNLSSFDTSNVINVKGIFFLSNRILYSNSLVFNNFELFNMISN